MGVVKLLGIRFVNISLLYYIENILISLSKIKIRTHSHLVTV